MLDYPSISLENRVVDVVQRLLMERSLDRSFARDDDLRDVGLTSLDMVNLVLSVEAEFGLTISAIDMTPANFRTVSAITKLVTAMLERT